MNENMKIYEAGRAVPPEAQKTINAGRLKGMTDINPVWRIKKLTEIFGAAGTGWGYTIDEQRLMEGAEGAVAIITTITLWYKLGDQRGEVHGVGGSMFVAKEKAGLYTDDEAFKKALTDALSVACKALGIGADVYYAADKTKYTEKQTTRQTTEKQAEHAPLICPECGKIIEDVTVNGKTYTAEWMFKKYDRCYECEKAARDAGQA